MSAPADFCPDSWAMVSCHSGGGCSHLENLDDPLRKVIETAAKEYLWRWSGRRFGLCEVSIRPCADPKTGNWVWSSWSGALGWFPFGPGASALGLYPFISNGNWFNAICGRCSNQRCSCGHSTSIPLTGAYDVVGVWIDGVLLNPATYRLDNLGLSRVDGNVWPRCQNMDNSPVSDESFPSLVDHSDTFLVTYRQGTPVPAGGELAAGTLACELAKQACGDKTCRLPRRASMVVREGTTVIMPTDEAFFTNGIVGIMEVDMFLSSVQHENRTSYSVTSPDSRRLRAKW